jgi:alkanesulfonate monooxygenase SsuD/methylene tetrahydromethanopterin reductase-like flavin-dependent oxidoreductase (luciferase family)
VPSIPIGVALGTIGLDGDAWLRAASRLAAAPIDRLWIWDHLMGRGAPERPVLEATTLAAAALAQHPTLQVGTLVLDVTKRHPALTAKIAATLDAIAPGRFTLGIGAGGDPAEHDALGMPYGDVADRIEALTTQVALARALLHGNPKERITLALPAALRAAASAPRPGTRVRLLIAGDHPSSIRLAASAADEWVAPVASFASGLQQLRAQEREEGGRRVRVHAHLLHELSAAGTFATTPFGEDPAGIAAAAAAAGADGLIVTVRTERDVEDAIKAIVKLG